jgi:uncharacterized membrane-anchored protein YitT (DUF2179 family)
MRNFMLSVVHMRPRFSWRGLIEYGLILLGALLQAIGLRLFMVPAQLANGGIAGLAQIINYYTGLPIGVMILLGNLPLFILGWRYLGGPRFALRTAFAVVAVSILTDTIIWLPFFPAHGLTQDIVLNTLFGGVISGIGYGLVYRGQATSGGSDILARMLTNWWNVSISQSYMLTDSLIMFLAGLSFSWEKALYALVSLYVSGLAAETATEGSNVVRTALIITRNPEPVTNAILTEMERGVTVLAGRGAYTGEQRTVLYSVVTRSEVVPLKALVRQADPQAFIVIGHAHEVLGEGFKPLSET